MTQDFAFVSLPQLKEFIQCAVKVGIESCFTQFSKKEVEKPAVFYTRKDLKELLHTSYPTVDKYTRLGVLRPTYFGRKVLYKESDLDFDLPKVKRLISKRGSR